jgi:hypothetical protein
VISVGDERLPPSIGGLIDLAFEAYVERAPLYIGLAVLVFVVCGAVDVAWSVFGGAPELKPIAWSLASVFVDAFVVAVVAVGVGTRIAGANGTPRAILGGAVERWLPVLGAMIIVQFIDAITSIGGAIGCLPDPPAAAIITAPVTWLLWGAMGLAGPVAALNGDRPTLAILTGFGRALAISLRVQNLPRLCLVAFATIVPVLLEEVLVDVLGRHGIPDGIFWAQVPIDALAVGPLAALQTVFALDFARRQGRLDQPR